MTVTAASSLPNRQNYIKVTITTSYVHRFLVHIVMHTSCYHTRRVPEAPILATGSTGSTYGSTGSTVAQVVQVAQVVHAHFVNIGARA